MLVVDRSLTPTIDAIQALRAVRIGNRSKFPLLLRVAKLKHSLLQRKKKMICALGASPNTGSVPTKSSMAADARTAVSRILQRGRHRERCVLDLSYRTSTTATSEQLNTNRNVLKQLAHKPPHRGCHKENEARVRTRFTKSHSMEGKERQGCQNGAPWTSLSTAEFLVDAFPHP